MPEGTTREGATELLKEKMERNPKLGTALRTAWDKLSGGKALPKARADRAVKSVALVLGPPRA